MIDDQIGPAGVLSNAVGYVTPEPGVWYATSTGGSLGLALPDEWNLDEDGLPSVPVVTAWRRFSEAVGEHWAWFVCSFLITDDQGDAWCGEAKISASGLWNLAFHAAQPRSHLLVTGAREDRPLTEPVRGYFDGRGDEPVVVGVAGEDGLPSNVLFEVRHKYLGYRMSLVEVSERRGEMAAVHQEVHIEIQVDTPATIAFDAQTKRQRPTPAASLREISPIVSRIALPSPMGFGRPAFTHLTGPLRPAAAPAWRAAAESLGGQCDQLAMAFRPHACLQRFDA